MAAILVAGCSSSQDFAVVKSQIAHFRELTAMKHFSEIYAEASDDLKKSATEQQLVNLLAAIDRKLGAARDSQDSGWKIDYGTSGTRVTLTLKTQFEKGNGIETFAYRVVGQQAQLMGYNISSNDLIIN